MKNLSDEELIVLFAQGTNKAFDELLHRYRKNLYNYIYSIVQNKDLTEDIFQDTFTKVIITIKSGRYNETGKFASFLFRVAHNKVIDVYRQEQSATQINEADVEYDLFSNKEICDAFDEYAPSIEESSCYNQVLKDVRRMIRFLPQNQKEIVIMRFYRDMSFKEIADALNISINTALGRIRYAVLNMRKMAEEHQISLVAC